MCRVPGVLLLTVSHRKMPIVRCGLSTRWLLRACPLTFAVFALCAGGCSGLQFPVSGRVATDPVADSDLDQRRAYKQLQHPTRLPLAYAKMQEQLGNLIEARKNYEHVMTEDPKSADAILGLARVDQLSGRTAEAERGFQRALALRPSDPHVLDSVGQFYVAQQRWGEAIQMLNTAMLRDPGERLYQYHLAVALATSGDINGSLPHFESSVGAAEAHYNVGYILMDQGRLNEAEQQFRVALSKKPTLQEAQIMLAEVTSQRPGIDSGRGETGAMEIVNAARQTPAVTNPPQQHTLSVQPRPPAIRMTAAQYAQAAAAAKERALFPGHSIPQTASVVSNTGVAAPLSTHNEIRSLPNQRVSASGAGGYPVARPIENGHSQY